MPIDEDGATFGERWEHYTVPRAIVEHLGWDEEWQDRFAKAYDWRVLANYRVKPTTRDQAEQVMQFAERVLQRAEEEVPT